MLTLRAIYANIEKIHPWSLTARPSKIVVGQAFPIGFRSPFRGELLNFRGVYIEEDWGHVGWGVQKFQWNIFPHMEHPHGRFSFTSRQVGETRRIWASLLSPRVVNWRLSSNLWVGRGYSMGPILGGGIKQYKSSNLYGSFAGFLLNNNALFGARSHIVTDPWLVTFLYGLLGL